MEGVMDIRWEQRFQNFENAYNTFCRALGRYNADPNDDIVQMALVQTKDYLSAEGFDEVQGSKQTIRTAFAAGIIGDAEQTEQWMNAVERRNLASHTYNSLVLAEGVAFITGTFYPLVQKLYRVLKKKCTD
jgi:hypothetical protein